MPGLHWRSNGELVWLGVGGFLLREGRDGAERVAVEVERFAGGHG